ncbi:MAG: hypothetical protein OEZ58_09610 [Gammaproteobacteria bacterium]|nr:hypothetical protein [Gammaproteobacteria bacterium]
MYITYLLSPGLHEEWNPLVSHFEMSWNGLLVSQLLLVCLVLLGWSRYLLRQRNPVSEPGLNLLRFVYFYFNGRDFTVTSWVKSFYTLPSKHYMKSNGAFIGFCLAMSTIIASIFAIVHNLLLLFQVNPYIQLIVADLSLYFISIFTLTVLLSANIFFIREYRQYKQKTAR